ncbi:SulP family inorganic anion transporter [Bryobacter aggregatus]|uniref:SulP family inorganic anion transporter n=1 Tax=Bryobacter aggregatus TaxID=360054 RepID=UPI0004E161F7|nr:SulP family inorganic anion transporter [Bryobacter aggregatus]
MKLPKIDYSWKFFGGDVFGGAIAALIALPYGLAMASLMGIPPIYGLFTSLISAPITAFLGRNPVLIGGTSTVTLPFLASAVHQQGLAGCAKVTLVAAVFMMVFSVLRLGRHIAKIPHTVVSGFSCGIGAMMVVNQLRTILGVQMPPGVAWPHSVPGQLKAVLVSLGTAQWAPLTLGIVVIGSAFFFSNLSKKLPAPLLGVVLAIGISVLFGMHEKEVGRLNLNVPEFMGFTWHPIEVLDLINEGFGLAIVSSINLLITSRVVEHFRGRHNPMHAEDADGELGAYGIANVVCGIFAAPMSVGIPARSLANVRCGGSSRVSNLVHAALLLLFLGMGSEMVSHIPLPALAGVTAYVGICLLEWGTWGRLLKMRVVDSGAFLSTALATLLINAVVAVAIGCAFYLVRWVYQTVLARPQSSETSGTSAAATSI